VEITEVRIKLMDDPNDRLQGFCSITFDGSFVIRDLKIIQGTKGPFVAMPSRKLTDRCPRCGTKNHLRARFCNDCSAELDEDRAVKDNDGRAKLYADISHPINSACRDTIQRRVLESFESEKILAQKAGYFCRYDDYGEDRIAKLKDEPAMTPAPPSKSQTLSSGKTIRIDPPEQEKPAATGDVARPHHLDPELPKSDATASGDDEFGAGV
jgi:stage V sporulation protein G